VAKERARELGRAPNPPYRHPARQAPVETPTGTRHASRILTTIVDDMSVQPFASFGVARAPAATQAATSSASSSTDTGNAACSAFVRSPLRPLAALSGRSYQARLRKTPTSRKPPGTRTALPAGRVAARPQYESAETPRDPGRLCCLLGELAPQRPVGELCIVDVDVVE
jgi:hypothetical protein